MAISMFLHRFGILLTTVFIFSLFDPSSQNVELLKKDIELLGKSLPGCYSNMRQYYAHALQRFPAGKRHFLLKAEFYKMEHPLFNDSLTIYFQHYTRSSNKPFSSGFYSFIADEKIRVITMKIIKFRPGMFEIKKPFHNYIIPNDSVSGVVLQSMAENEAMLTHTSCDMYWTKVSDLRFIGITGSQCLASLGKSSVRISVSMTVAESKLKLTEGWYNVKDGTRLTQVNIPYLLSKKPHPPKLKPRAQVPNPVSGSTVPRTYKDHLVSNSLEIHENTRPDSRPRPDRIQWNPQETIARRPTRHLPTTRVPTHKKKMKPKRQMRTYTKKRKMCRDRLSKKPSILRNFRQVLRSLTLGYEVHFHVDLTACTKPEQARMDHYTFGGRVTDFLYIKERGSLKRKERIYFSTMKTAMSYSGMEFITREMTILRGNRVEVKIRKDFSDESRVPLKYTFHCRLYNNRKGRGSIRMMSSPTANIRKVSVLEKMTTILGQGRDLRLVADVSQCQGSRSNSVVVIGGSITDYDIVNDGKTIESFLPVDQAVSPSYRSGRRNGYIAQIFKGGDVILTWVSGRKEEGIHSALPISSAYHCKTTSRSPIATNENDISTVSIFYRK